MFWVARVRDSVWRVQGLNPAEQLSPCRADPEACCAVREDLVVSVTLNFDNTA